MFERIDHEDNLLSFRTNWVVMSQAFLLSAYGICAGASSERASARLDTLTRVLPWAAIATLLLLWISILGGIGHIRGLRRARRRLPEPANDVPIRRIVRWAGIAPSTVIPAVFLLMWMFVLLG